MHKKLLAAAVSLTLICSAAVMPAAQNGVLFNYAAAETNDTSETSSSEENSGDAKEQNEEDPQPNLPKVIGDYTCTMMKDGTYSVVYSGNKKTVKEIIVPENLDGVDVTRLSAGAFENCVNLKSVTISDNIATIGQNAFGGCKSLKTVIMPKNVTAVNAKAFDRSDLQISVYHNSYAEKYAKKYKFDIEYLDQHTYTKEVVKPTYFTKGYTLYTCKHCGYSYKTDETAMLKLAQSAKIYTASAQNSIKLSWSKSKNADGYEVYRYNIDSKKWVKLAAVEQNTYTSTGLKSGKRYAFAVKAYKSSGSQKVYSLSTQIKAVTRPSKPALTGLPGKKRAVLSWNEVNGADGYEVYMTTSAKGGYKLLKKTSANSFIKGSLTATKKYYFAVKAYKKGPNGIVYHGQTSYCTVTPNKIELPIGNSSLVDFMLISPNSNNPRNHQIDTITIHHMAVNWTVEQCGASFHNVSRQASSNYGIDSYGRVGLYVEEKNRSWCSSSPSNDNRAITIEVANDQPSDAGGWHVSDAAMRKLIELCTDICKRNNIKRLVFTGDTSGNLTMHKWFAPTLCPGPYLESKFPYIANEVNKRLK